MIDVNKFQQTPMGMAVTELSEHLEKEKIPAVSLNVIGGFALMMREIRDPNGVTDIDYVGNSLPEDFSRIADEIGARHNLGKGWINNDVMLSGSTLEDLEFATGKLHFEHAFNIGNISINVLEEPDLLRMKLIAIDTGLTATEVGGEFTRMKDLPDTVILMNRAKISPENLRNRYGSYISESTAGVIAMYITNGTAAVEQEVDKRMKEYQKRLLQSRQKNGGYTTSRYLSNLLDNLFEQAEKEETDNGHPDF